MYCFLDNYCLCLNLPDVCKLMHLDEMLIKFSFRMHPRCLVINMLKNLCRILSRVCLLPEISTMSASLHVAMMANVTRLMTGASRSIQALCLELLLNVKESGGCFQKGLDFLSHFYAVV